MARPQRRSLPPVSTFYGFIHPCLLLCALPPSSLCGFVCLVGDGDHHHHWRGRDAFTPVGRSFFLPLRSLHPGAKKNEKYGFGFALRRCPQTDRVQKSSILCAWKDRGIESVNRSTNWPKSNYCGNHSKGGVCPRVKSGRGGNILPKRRTGRRPRDGRRAHRPLL